jgi:hypothetical protein
MRADIQRKPLGFQEVTASHYRCVSFCVTRLTRSQQTLAHSLVFETKGFLEQPSNTSLLQSSFWSPSVTLSNARFSGRQLMTQRGPWWYILPPQSYVIDVYIRIYTIKHYFCCLKRTIKILFLY